MDIKGDAMKGPSAIEASPLSPVQRGRMATCASGAIDAVTRIQLHATGPLDTARLERAFESLQARYELLSMRVRTLPEVDALVQFIDDPSRDLDDELLPPSSTTNIRSGRARLSIRALPDQGGAQVGLELPWLLADRPTLELLADELIAAYAADGHFDERMRSPKEDVLQFLDVAAWQESLHESEEAAEARRFWANVDSTPLGPCRLFPEGFKVSARDVDAGQDVLMTRSLDRSVTAMLMAWATRHELAAEDGLRAALSALLYRHGAASVSIGLRVDGRDASELIQVMGPLDRWIPVPTTPPDPLGDEGFVAHARRLAIEANEARRWADAFDGAGRDGQPLGPFTAAFGARQTAPIDPAHLTVEAAGVQFKRGKIDQGPLVAQLMLEVEPVADEIELSWAAAAKTMDAAMLAQVADEFEVLLAGALDGDPTLDTLPLTSVHTRGAWMAQATTPAAPPLRRILERFLDHVANDPEAPCIVDESDRFTRQDVELASRSVAAAIRRMGIDPGARIGLALPRSGAVVAAFIGSWRAGTAYVPLDLDLPAQAIATRIEEGALAAVIVEAAAVRAQAAWLPQGVPLIPMELDMQNLRRSLDEAPPLDASEGRALAYGLFTSGSTGHPKLVGIEHAALAGYVAAVESRLGFESGWSFATVSTFASDLGHTSIFSSLATGGVLHVVGSDRAMDPQKLAERFRA
ncbi:MAG: AMP-binding protein, partial [Myxococcota bacterium]